MEANNLMAVSTADGISAGAGAQKPRGAAAGSRAQTTSGKKSFSDTFGALQSGADTDAAKTSTRDVPAKAQIKYAQQAAENREPSQDTQDVTANTPKTAADTKTGKNPQTGLSADENAAASAVAAAALAIADVPVDGAGTDEKLDVALAEILERYGLMTDAGNSAPPETVLRSLLQELPAETRRSQNLLRVLSGEPLAAEDALTAPPSAETGAQTARFASLDAALPAAVRTLPQKTDADTTHLPASAVSDGGAAAENAAAVPAAMLNTAPQIAADTTGRMQAEQPAPMTALMQAGTAAQPEAAAAAALSRPPVAAEPAGRSAAELLGDTPAAEEQPDAPSALDVLAQRTMRHDTMQRDTQQEQQPQGGKEENGAFRAAAFQTDTAVRPTESAPQMPQPVAAQTNAAPIQENIASAPVQETQARPQPDYEIPRQIVEQARLLRTLTDTQMVIRLKPEHLGDLTLRVAVGSDGAVQASFHSDNAHVRSVIENSLVQLRQELSNQGIKVDRVGVYTGLADGQMPQGQGQDAWQQGSQSRGETRNYARGDADNYIEGIEESTPVAVQTSGGIAGANGVDYRV